MVAKTYQSLSTIGEPYEKNGKMYIVVTMKNGNNKEVRWYSEREYAKMYPETIVTVQSNDFMKDAFGFNKGYIDIIKENVNYDDEAVCDFNREHKIFQYSNYFGWFIKHENELSKYFVTVRIFWDEVKDKSLEEIQMLCRERRQNTDNVSQFQYEIGERKTMMLELVDKKTRNDYYGVKFTYTFVHDATGNTFQWVTAAVDLEPQRDYEVTGTIKAHEVIDGIKTTVLTRCKIK